MNSVSVVTVLAPGSQQRRRSAAAWSPGDVDGLYAWYDADAISGLNNGDPVSTWTDESGNARNQTQVDTARPTYQTNIQNGLPGVRFDGSNDYMNVQVNYDNANPEITVALAAIPRATQVGTEFLVVAGATAGWPWQGWAQGTFGYMMQDYGYRPHMLRGDATMQIWTGAPPTMNSPYFLAYRVDTTDHRLRINGTDDGVFVSVGGNFNFSHLWLGGGSNGGTPAFFPQWDYLEIVVYNSRISDLNLNRLDNYVNNKWAIW